MANVEGLHSACRLQCAGCDLALIFPIAERSEIRPLALRIHECLLFWNEWQGNVEATIRLVACMIEEAVEAARVRSRDNAGKAGRNEPWREGTSPFFLMFCANERRLLIGAAPRASGFDYDMGGMAPRWIPLPSGERITAYEDAESALLAFSRA